MGELQLSLVDRCRNGDADAWRDLVDQYSPYVYAIVIRAYRIPRDDAEDVFQDVFARVFERLEMLRDDDALRAWIGQVARNLCIDHQRRARPGAELPETLESDGQRELDELTEALYVQQALGELSGECADILDRFFRRDQPYRAIAADTGLAEGTIASRISRCLARLRDVIEGRSGGSPASGGT
jgi:RNA polymerase sigma-70 factor (ECF subfamily)